MANVPTPRNFTQTLNDLIDGFQSKKGGASLREGNPLLSILESGARSDLRSSQDIFSALASIELERKTELQLDAAGAEIELPRFGLFPASGTVTIGDSRVSQIASKIFPGLPPPIVGSTQVHVSDASGFPATGQIYIGRGTSNVEGPLTYTSRTAGVGYWTVQLAVGSETARYHNLNEPVVLGQMGDREIPARTVLQTTQNGLTALVQFRTIYAATVLDGEAFVQNVAVTALTPGTVGNVAVGALNSFANPPFTGATVTNQQRFSNGIDTESDDAYRERIRAARKARRLGTTLALKTFLTGIVAPDENKRAASVSVVRRSGAPTSVYIDDGNGYEPQQAGVALEILADRANGGETCFQLQRGTPVAKASVETLVTAPYDLSGSPILAVRVGGALSQHSFSTTSFRSAAAASAYEVVAAINSDTALLFSARTTGSGTSVALTAKTETNEDISVVAPAVGTDANDVFGFPPGRSDTVRLYLNDRLLSKDGAVAQLSSNVVGAWSPIASGATLEIVVDGVDVPTSPPNTYVFTDQDFLDAQTGYVTVSATNSLESWAQVFNAKIPGLQASVDNGTLLLVSNRGRSADASIKILGGSLIASGMFVVASATGADSDYVLDRGVGQITLNDNRALAPNDRLVVGASDSRAFVSSPVLSTVAVLAVDTTVVGESGAELWVAVDGAAQIVPVGLGASTAVTVSSVASTNIERVRYQVATSAFSDVLAGDWVIAYDLALSAANRGAWRIAEASATSIIVERDSTWNSPEVVALGSGALTVVRTSAQLQRVFVPAGVNYTATSLAAVIHPQLTGASAIVHQTTTLRILTNSQSVEGDIAIVAVNSEGAKFGLPIGGVANDDVGTASVVGRAEVGTPSFDSDTVVSSASTTSVTVSGAGVQDVSRFMAVSRSASDVGGARQGHKSFSSPVVDLTGNTLTLRTPSLNPLLADEKVYSASTYAITGTDSLAVVVDGDDTSKRFVCPMFRRLTPGSSSYSASNVFKDKDNADASLAKVFGTDMSWLDFAVYMPSRVKSHGAPDTNKTMLWRYYRPGAEGNVARLQYVYPTAANATATATASAITSAYTDIAVTLGSGAARTGVNATNSTRLGVNIATGTEPGLQKYQYVWNLPIATAEREVRLNYSAKTAGWALLDTVTGGTNGATGVIQNVIGGAPGAASGTIILTGVTGTFLSGEPLEVSAVPVATAASTQYGVTKLTLTLPAGVTNHGFTVGNSLHMQYNGTGTTAGFVTSAPTVSVLEVPSATSINYLENGAAIAPTAGVGTVSYDTAEAGLGSSTVVPGDIVSFSAAAGLPSTHQRVGKASTIASGNLQFQAPTSGAVGGTLTWGAISSPSNVVFYPLATADIVSIAAAINAQPTSPVTAVAVGDGVSTNGVITHATYEPAPDGLGSADPWYYLSDGVNYIASHSVPVNTATDFTFTFKSPVTAALGTNSDFLNETLLLVPVTARGVADYLNSPGPGGLFASAKTELSTSGRAPQMTSLTSGAEGKIQCQGGRANALVATVRGSATQVAGTHSVVAVSSSDTLGLGGGHWVRVQNALPGLKNRITASTGLTSIAADGTFTLTTSAWDFANVGGAPIAGQTWQFDGQGDFQKLTLSAGTANLTGVQEGDWIHISSEISDPTHTSPGTHVSSRNSGLFRVVRVNVPESSLWIENPNALEEIKVADVAFLTYDSIVPGDTITIGYAGWGLGNIGTWTVTGIDLSTYLSTHGNTQLRFTVSVAQKATAVSGAVSPLGANSALVRVTEGSASHLFKRVRSISPDAVDANLAHVKFDSWAGSDKCGEALGTVLVSLDKLGFPGETARGSDGYNYNTGLIGEAAKKAYGLDTDTANYPGIASAGTNLIFDGPTIRRIIVSIAIRARSGVSLTDIREKVQSAVAAVINGAAVGATIALSDIVTAAQGVGGVLAVTLLSPSYGAGSDTISLQPMEKSMVLSPREDVLVSFV